MRIRQIMHFYMLHACITPTAIMKLFLPIIAVNAIKSVDDLLNEMRRDDENFHHQTESTRAEVVSIMRGGGRPGSFIQEDSDLFLDGREKRLLKEFGRENFEKLKKIEKKKEEFEQLI